MRVTDRQAVPAGNPLCVLVTESEVHVVGISRVGAEGLLREALRSVVGEQIAELNESLAEPSCPTCGGSGEAVDCCPGAVETCPACSGSGVRLRGEAG